MKRLLEYLTLRTLLVGLGFVPYRTMLEIARIIARFAYWVPSTPRRRCLKYLKRAYGDEIDEKRAEEIAPVAVLMGGPHAGSEFTSIMPRSPEPRERSREVKAASYERLPLSATRCTAGSRSSR